METQSTIGASAQTGTTGTNQRASMGDGSDLHVRLVPGSKPGSEFGGSVGAASVDSWDSPHPLAQMVADLVAASGGTQRESSAGVLTARFPDAMRTIAAARRLTALVAGYGSSEFGQGSMVAVGVTSAPKAGKPGQKRGDETVAARNYLATPAALSQVVLVGRVCAQARGVAGLVLRNLDPAPATAGNTAFRTEICELVWQAPTGLGQPSSPSVDSSDLAATKVRSRLPGADRSGSPSVPEGSPEGARLSTGDFTRQRPISDSAKRALPGASSEIAADFLQRLMARVRSNPARAGMWAGGSALAVLLALGAVFLAGNHSAKPPAQPTTGFPATGPGQPGAPASGSTVSPLSDASSRSQRQGQPRSESPAQKSPPIEAKIPAPPPAGRRANLDAASKQDAVGKQDVAPPQDRAVDSFSAIQIPQLLQRGDQALGAGCYDQAIGYYRRVTALQSRNEQALQGIERARQSKQVSGADSSRCN